MFERAILIYTKPKSVLVTDFLDGKPQVQRLAQAPQGFFCLPGQERVRVHPAAALSFLLLFHTSRMFPFSEGIGRAQETKPIKWRMLNVYRPAQVTQPVSREKHVPCPSTHSPRYCFPEITITKFILKGYWKGIKLQPCAKRGSWNDTLNHRSWTTMPGSFNFPLQAIEHRAGGVRIEEWDLLHFFHEDYKVSPRHTHHHL